MADEIDAALVGEATFVHEGGRYGWRRYEYPHGGGWVEFWATRAGDWGTRVFATLEDAARFVGTRRRAFR